MTKPILPRRVLSAAKVRIFLPRREKRIRASAKAQDPACARECGATIRHSSFVIDSSFGFGNSSLSHLHILPPQQKLPHRLELFTGVPVVHVADRTLPLGVRERRHL